MCARYHALIRVSTAEALEEWAWTPLCGEGVTHKEFKVQCQSSGESSYPGANPDIRLVIRAPRQPRLPPALVGVPSKKQACELVSHKWLGRAGERACGRGRHQPVGLPEAHRGRAHYQAAVAQEAERGDGWHGPGRAGHHQHDQRHHAVRPMRILKPDRVLDNGRLGYGPGHAGQHQHDQRHHGVRPDRA